MNQRDLKIFENIEEMCCEKNYAENLKIILINLDLASSFGYFDISKKQIKKLRWSNIVLLIAALDKKIKKSSETEESFINSLKLCKKKLQNPKRIVSPKREKDIDLQAFKNVIIFKRRDN